MTLNVILGIIGPQELIVLLIIGAVIYFVIKSGKKEVGKEVEKTNSTSGGGEKERFSNHFYEPLKNHKMTTNTTFEDEFTSLCELLGANSSTLFQYLGQYDAISTNSSGTRFMFYNEIKTNFIVDKDNIVTGFKVPNADAEGHKLFENSSYYSLNGIHLGMTHSEVREIMGDPDIKSNRGNELDAIYDLLFWSYSSNICHAKSGKKYIIRYMFEDIAGEDMEAEYILGEFHVDLL